ncbi:uncharacterized protein BX664DRAFT_342463 [Halteromyces radiatus]|uniref:uncharacterized protein n=1 Tax=Halteromyces radiatus TaxID=101107 RepID=UPI00222108E1|nr:uncharacterized protein BX664DRAFT_342463 [Halteromyces radiatus]KAI8078673.1 hypothetical protein BX664DRAFT_342463 [Halteromyces radiatus]
MSEDLYTSTLQAIGAFDYSAANKLATRLLRAYQPFGSIMMKLINCENLYTQLSFMKPKWFMRKDSLLNSMYTYLVDDAVKEIHIFESNTTVTNYFERASILSILTGLSDLCTIRQNLINIYQRIASQSSKTPQNDLLEDLQNMMNTVEHTGLAQRLGFLGIGVKKEISILAALLRLRMVITDYAFQDACMALYEYKQELLDWKSQCEAQDYPEKSSVRHEEVKESYTWPFGLFSSTSGSDNKSRSGDIWPPTIRWLSKYLINLTAKMTLYFHTILLEKERLLVDDEPERTLWKGIEPDYFEMISTFRKRYGAHSIGLVYEVKTEKPFFPEGFVCHGTPYEPPRGIHSFPFIFCLPPQPPTNHLPNIISIIQGSQTKLNDSKTGPTHFFDNMLASTYYLMRVDEHGVFVIVYQEKHQQKEPTTISFMSNMVSLLRGSSVISELLRMD